MSKSKTSRRTLVLAYDLGGTKVAVGVVDSSGKILAFHREPALLKKGKKATLDQLVRLGKEMIVKFPAIEAVGVASAGPLDPRKGILLDPTNFTGPDGNWGRVPLAAILSKGLRKKVFLENDERTRFFSVSHSSSRVHINYTYFKKKNYQEIE